MKDILYSEMPPPELLQDLIKCFWYYENPSPQPKEFTILPDGYFDYIVSLQEGQVVSAGITGLWTDPVPVCIQPHVRQYSVRFRLAAAEFLLNQKISSLLNSFQPVQLFMPPVHTLPDLSFIKFTHVASSFFLSRLKEAASIDSRKKCLFNLLTESQGRLTVEQYARKSAISSRQINRYFQDWFGLPLKTYCKIIRCYHSYSSIAKGELHPGAQFFDQAHFIHDVKNITGVSPKQLYKNENGRFLQLSTKQKH
ncbi:MAG: AraC family transcriptional regulator [Ignavibacteria bacterium]|nr:AraC family transcriptional regulator [Ignavibacteria bacterium]